MKSYFKILLLFLVFIIPQKKLAQDKKPKVVLVLSGGGAKGVAHIPLLQALDSLHIVPDLIVGNSMGSVIGGLYAMGYSGDSIAKITKNVNWNKLLGEGVSFDKVSVEEKSEFERYLVGLDIKNGKPSSLNSIINDQNLREFISELTFPVYNITDFDSLSIPFRALATDLVEGKEVVLKNGSLATAIRASMSLPAIFNPVPYNETLLVDGGVVNNFPTDIAKNLGADIIIGSDVGGGMEPKEKLNNFVSVLVQTSMLTSNINDPKKRELCDILVDHLPNLTYSTGDFAKSNKIYEEGKIATLQNMDALVNLSKKLNTFKQLTHQLPEYQNEIKIDSIVLENISFENYSFILERINIKPQTTYSKVDLINGINRAMGTNLFSKINSRLITIENKNIFELSFIEHSKNQLNTSIHYDTYRGVGILFNFTGRNLLGKSSRFILTADIAQQPRARIEYQKIFSEQKKWWWNSELYGENLIQKIYVDNKFANDLRYRSFQFNNQINKNINSFKSYVGLSLNYQYTFLKPRASADINDYLIKNYKFNNIELSGHFSYNDFDKVFFATQGTVFNARINRSFFHQTELNFTNTKSSTISGDTNGFTKLELNFDKRIPFNKKLVGIIGATCNFIFEDALKSNEISFSNLGYGGKFFLGGTSTSPTNNRTLFLGLNEDELAVTQLMKINIGLQSNLLNKVYLTPHLDFASLGFEKFKNYIDHAFAPKGKWQDRTEPSFLMSAGAQLSYFSILGPINFDASWVNDHANSSFYFSIGLLLNPS